MRSSENTDPPSTGPGETEEQETNAGRTRRARWRIADYVAVVLAVLVIVVVPATLWLQFRRYCDMARRANCRERLRAIGSAISMYSNDFDQHLPPNLSVLCPKYATRGVFLCPNTTEYQQYRCASKVVQGALFQPDRGSYVYVRLGKPLDKVPKPHDKIILAYEKPENHSSGANVLFLDGHVEWKEEFAPPKQKAPITP